MTRAAIALGANLGDPCRQLDAACQQIAALPDTTWLATSPYYRTQPVGYLAQDDFINAAVLVETQLSASTLLHALLEIERAVGRVRDIPNGPRTLDLDLLLYGDETVFNAELCLPHPRMHQRAFVLAPLADIAPEWVIPGRGRVCECLQRCEQNGVSRLTVHAKARH